MLTCYTLAGYHKERKGACQAQKVDEKGRRENVSKEVEKHEQKKVWEYLLGMQ